MHTSYITYICDVTCEICCSDCSATQAARSPRLSGGNSCRQVETGDNIWDGLRGIRAIMALPASVRRVFVLTQTTSSRRVVSTGQERASSTATCRTDKSYGCTCVAFTYMRQQESSLSCCNHPARICIASWGLYRQLSMESVLLRTHERQTSV